MSQAPVAYVYMVEETSPQDNFVKDFEIKEIDGVKFADFFTGLHTVNKKNRNVRLYRKQNLQDGLNSEKNRYQLAHGGIFGEMNHPFAKIDGEKLSLKRLEDIDMENTSHKFLSFDFDGDILVGHTQTDSGTDAGRNLLNKMIQGFIPSFSCRSIGAILGPGNSLLQGEAVIKKLITYDWVFFPSDYNAEMIRKKAIQLTEAQYNEAINGKSLTLPLLELCKDTAKKDENMKYIMESFGISENEIIGFHRNKNQIIVSDDSSILYCNMTPDSRRKVSDIIKMM